MQDFGKVLVLTGGWSNEREVSLMSGQAVYDALRRRGVDVALLDINRQVVEQLQAVACDRVFIAVHGEDGESGFLQAVLEGLNIPYAGSGQLACAFSWDKLRTKLLWRGCDLPVAEWQVVTAESDWQAVVAELGLPLFVKPTMSGSSVGVTRVDDISQLPAAFIEANRHGGQVLVERAYEAGEYFVGILGAQVLPSIKSEVDEGFYDYQAKYFSDDTRFLCPAGLSDADEQCVRDLAWQAYQTCGCRGYGRVDILRHHDGRFVLSELNTVPGLTSHSLVPQSAATLGIDYPELICRILADSLVVR